MKKKMHILLIGLLCVVLLLAAILLAVMLNKGGEAGQISDAIQTQSTALGETTQTQNHGDSTLATTMPDQPATDSTQPTTTPSQPTTPPVTESTQPAVKPTEPSQTTTEPTEPTVKPTEPPQTTTESTQPAVKPTEPTEDPVAPPVETPPSVEIPSEKDPVTGELVPITFPCQVPGYDLVIEKMAPYSGMFVEDGSNAQVQNVAMLLVHNNGETAIEYTQIRVACGEEELLFDISALPAGERLVVQEKSGKSISEGDATSASALIVQRADMEMSESKVKVIDNGDNTLTIQNLTDEIIPTVRVFYKYYMEDETLFVGGIAFTVRISRLGAGASVTIRPSHYTSQTSRVVMVLTYDSEV